MAQTSALNEDSKQLAAVPIALTLAEKLSQSREEIRLLRQKVKRKDDAEEFVGRYESGLEKLDVNVMRDNAEVLEAEAALSKASGSTRKLLTGIGEEISAAEKLIKEGQEKFADSGQSRVSRLLYRIRPMPKRRG